MENNQAREVQTVSGWSFGPQSEKEENEHGVGSKENTQREQM